MRTGRFVPLAAAAATAALVMGVTGCSSSSQPASSSPAPASSAPASSAAPTQSASESTSVLPPVIVTEGQKKATAKVGDAVVFSVDKPETWTIESSDPSVLTVTPGSNDGSAVFNPGGVALKAGEAIVVLTPDSGAGEPWKVTVTVEEAMTGSVLPPVIVEEGQTAVDAKIGDTVVFNVSEPDAYGIESSDPNVLAVTPGGTQGTAVFNPGGVALKAGTSTVTLTPLAGGGAPWTVTVTVS